MIRNGIFSFYGFALHPDRERALADIESAIGIAALQFPSEDPTRSVTTVLYQRTINALRELLNKTWYQRCAGDIQPDQEPTTTPSGMNPYLILTRAVEKGIIRANDQTIMVLHSEGYSDTEIGQKLGMKTSAVRERRYHVVQQLNSDTARVLRSYQRKK